MTWTSVGAVCIALALGAWTTLGATGNAIGMAAASGPVVVDHSRVVGNATLFEGSLIETGSGSSQLRLDNGAKARLAAETRATVHEARLALEGGQGEFESAGAYEVECRSLHILGGPGTKARVKAVSGRAVTVEVLRGSVRVSNAVGVWIARVEAGNALNLEPQEAGASLPTRASGCLLAKAGNYILAERTNKVILEVKGPGLAESLGNQVEITGGVEPVAPRVEDASQVIRVAGIRQLSKGGCTSVAQKLGVAAAGAAVTTSAATGAGAATGATGAGAASAGAAASAAAAGAATTGAASAGISTATFAFIGGVAASTAVGGLAVAGALPGQSPGYQNTASR